jgi:hypothetical protein
MEGHGDAGSRCAGAIAGGRDRAAFGHPCANPKRDIIPSAREFLREIFLENLFAPMRRKDEAARGGAEANSLTEGIFQGNYLKSCLL